MQDFLHSWITTFVGGNYFFLHWLSHCRWNFTSESLFTVSEDLSPKHLGAGPVSLCSACKSKSGGECRYRVECPSDNYSDSSRLIKRLSLYLPRLPPPSVLFTCAAGAKWNRRGCVSIKAGLNNSAAGPGCAWIQLHKTAIVALRLDRTTHAQMYN